MSLRIVKQTKTSRPCLSERCKRIPKRGLYCEKCCRRQDIPRTIVRTQHAPIPHPCIRCDGLVVYTHDVPTLAWDAYAFEPPTYKDVLAMALRWS